MKNLKEKRMLARLARNAGQPDLALEESIRREEELEKKLFVKTLTEQVTKPSVEPVAEKVFVQELVDDPRSASGQSLVQRAAESIHAAPSTTPVLQEKLRDSELEGIRKQVADLIAKMGTLSWGGGGTGVVRFVDLDDSRDVFNRMDSKVYTFMQDTPPLLANGADQWINTASGLEYTNINTGQFVIPTWVEFGPALTQNVAAPEPVWYNYPFTTVTTSGHTVANTEFYVGVNYNGNVAIILPTQPAISNGYLCVIKDESGNAGNPANWIDIYGSGGDLVDGQNFIRLNIDHASLQLFYRDGWRII